MYCKEKKMRVNVRTLVCLCLTLVYATRVFGAELSQSAKRNSTLWV